MRIFRPYRISAYSDKECLLLWQTLMDAGLITLGDRNKFSRTILNQYLDRQEYGVINPTPPKADAEFDKICANYREAWNKHKPTIKQTYKVASQKETDGILGILEHWSEQNAKTKAWELEKEHKKQLVITQLQNKMNQE
jgi:hypothetical protein